MRVGLGSPLGHTGGTAQASTLAGARHLSCFLPVVSDAC